jgi:NADH-quinone oxidoreductase subunit N
MNRHFLVTSLLSGPLFLPEIYLFFAITAFLAFFALFDGSRRRAVVAYATALTLALTLALVLAQPAGAVGSFLGLLETNPFLSLWKVALLGYLLASVAVVYLALRFDSRFGYEYFFLLLCFGFAALLFLGSSDLIMFYLAAELQSFCMYILVAYHRSSSLSIEGGLKYFILGSVASAFIIFGIALLYLATGSTAFGPMAHYFFFTPGGESLTLPAIGAWLLLAGLLFKVSAFPFHFWAPDVYQAAPYGLVLVLAVVSKLGGLVLLVRTCFGPFFDLLPVVQPLLYLAGLGSFLVGTFLSLRPRSIKRFLAYSSMVHVGFILLALATLSLSGLQAALAYVQVYLALSFLLVAFLALGGDRAAPQTFGQLATTLAPGSPLQTFGLALVVVSMAGIPPLLGFLPKFQVFMVLLEGGFGATTLALMALSVVGAYYYFRIVFALTYDQGGSGFLTTLVETRANRLGLSPLGLLLVASVALNLGYFLFYDRLLALVASTLVYLFY